MRNPSIRLLNPFQANPQEVIESGDGIMDGVHLPSSPLILRPGAQMTIKFKPSFKASPLSLLFFA
jgi:hypothetical protein